MKDKSKLNIFKKSNKKRNAQTIASGGQTRKTVKYELYATDMRQSSGWGL